MEVWPEPKGFICVFRGWMCYRCDVSDRDAVLSLASKVKEEVGDVSILVNNAGIMNCHPLLRHNPQEIRKTYDINVLAHFWVSFSGIYTTFTPVRKAAISDNWLGRVSLSVRPSTWKNSPTLSPRRVRLSSNFLLRNSTKLCPKQFKFWQKSHTSNGHLTWRHHYVYNNIFSDLVMKGEKFRTKGRSENQNMSCKIHRWQKNSCRTRRLKNSWAGN